MTESAACSRLIQEGAIVRLTVYTDYALRLLMYLALKKDGLATIAEIATSHDISRNHLAKVAHALVVADYVVSVRGRGGGLRLAGPVEAIIIGEVVRKIEPGMALIVCLKADDTSLFPVSVVRGAMKLASAAFLETLDGYTLGDLIQPHAKLNALLTISPSGRDVARHAVNRIARRG
jgi:Rrf2 family nitric oxide-sensitive transcriptional repressor